MRTIAPIPLLLVLALAANPAAATTQQHDPALRAALEAAIADADSFQDRFDAEVWLLDMSQRLRRLRRDLSEDERLHILRAAHREAHRAQLEPELVLAVMEVESAFDRFAISRSGALGLMQVMPFWLAEIGRPEANLMDIDTNLRLGCTILRFYLDRERGRLNRALAAYNGSLGSERYPRKVVAALRQRWFKR